MITACLRIATASFATFVLAGCASSAPEAGSDDADVSSAKHAQATQACATQFDADTSMLDASDTPAALRISTAAQTCFRKANDAAVNRIEKSLKSAGAASAGTTKTVFAAFRSDMAKYCAPDADADPVYTALCTATAERNLAALIDAYAALGIAPTPVDRSTYDSNYVTCFDEFVQNTATVESGTGTPSDAASALSACTTFEAGQRLQRSSLGQTDAQSWIQTQHSVCAILTGGSELATYESENCTSDAVILLEHTAY